LNEPIERFPRLRQKFQQLDLILSIVIPDGD